MRKEWFWAHFEGHTLGLPNYRIYAYQSGPMGGVGRHYYGTIEEVKSAIARRVEAGEEWRNEKGFAVECENNNGLK